MAKPMICSPVSSICWGEAKATNFLRQIAQDQKVTLSRQSHTFMTQLVATGEHDVIVDGYVHNAVALKEKGAPYRLRRAEPDHRAAAIDHRYSRSSSSSLRRGAVS
jgi:hypothetical protein